jgi:hypothetical protein
MRKAARRLPFLYLAVKTAHLADKPLILADKPLLLADKYLFQRVMVLLNRKKQPISLNWLLHYQLYFLL